MLGDGLSVALAGLLHDVGKLYSRARWGERDDQVPDRTHTAYTAHFVREHAGLFRGAGLDPDWLARTASRHHEGWRDRPQYRPETPEEWCVALADTYASKEREEGEGGGSPPEVPLSPPFRRLLLGGEEGREGGYSPVGAGGGWASGPGGFTRRSGPTSPKTSTSGFLSGWRGGLRRWPASPWARRPLS